MILPYIAEITVGSLLGSEYFYIAGPSFVKEFRGIPGRGNLLGISLTLPFYVPLFIIPSPKGRLSRHDATKMTRRS